MPGVLLEAFRDEAVMEGQRQGSVGVGGRRFVRVQVTLARVSAGGGRSWREEAERRALEAENPGEFISQVPPGLDRLSSLRVRGKASSE